MTAGPPALHRRLGMLDAVTLGLAAMLGAGVFVAFAPAAAVAGPALPWALLLAAGVAWANADSSARLAARLPVAGGTYAYARARLSPAWGGAAGTAFLVGKTISASAICLTLGLSLWPEQARAVAVGAVAVLTALAAAGVQRGALVSRVVVVVVLVTLGAVVLTAFVPGADAPPGTGPAVTGPAEGAVGASASDPGAPGVLRGAGILFFAFAGYARIATLGEEVRDPRRTLPRAIAVALGVVLVTYALVGLAVVQVLGLEGLAASARPVVDTAAAVGGGSWAAPVAAVAGLAAFVSGLGVLLGLSRTTWAMARDGVLPRALVHLGGAAAARRPIRAQLAVGAAVATAVALLDVARAITVSSAAVLVYYAIAHLAALTLPGRGRRVVPVLGLAGCLTVATALLLGALGR